MPNYEEPITVDEKTIVIPVTRQTVLGRRIVTGVITVHDGQTTWTPTVDANLIALIGVTTGLIAGTLATIAVVRRPPWPVTTFEQLTRGRH